MFSLPKGCWPVSEANGRLLISPWPDLLEVLKFYLSGLSFSVAPNGALPKVPKRTALRDRVAASECPRDAQNDIRLPFMQSDLDLSSHCGTSRALCGGSCIA
jgi:hypothetical protein